MLCVYLIPKNYLLNNPKLEYNRDIQINSDYLDLLQDFKQIAINKAYKELSYKWSSMLDCYYKYFIDIKRSNVQELAVSFEKLNEEKSNYIFLFFKNEVLSNLRIMLNEQIVIKNKKNVIII